MMNGNGKTDLAMVLNSVSNSNYQIEIKDTGRLVGVFFVVVLGRGKLLSPNTKNPAFFMEFFLTTRHFGIIVIALSV